MVGFYYDFIPSREISLPFLHLVEERIRKCVKENIAVEMMEMGVKNGAEYLHHLGHHYSPEEAAEKGKGTLTLIRIGDFADVLSPPFVKNTKELCHLRLLSLEKIGKNRFRIFGSVHGSDEGVKEEGRLFAKYQKKNHLIDGQKEGFFHWEEKGFFWHAKGLALKEMCAALWKESVRKQNFRLIETPLSGNREEKICMHRSFFEKGKKELPFRSAELFWEENILGKEILFEGLLNPHWGERTLELSFVSQKELFNECISSLQFIDKILNMVQFRKHVGWVFSSCKRAKMFAEEGVLIRALEKLGIRFLREERAGKGVVVKARIRDRLGREWTGPYLAVRKEKEDVALVERSSLGLLERWVAFLLEIAPEQISRFLKEKGPH